MEMQSARFSKGTTRLTMAAGAGMSFKVSSVMTPKVPSDPIISWSRLYPELVLDTEEPNRVTSPVGRTTVMAFT